MAHGLDAAADASPLAVKIREEQLGKFTKREKILTSLVIALSLATISFALFIWGPKLFDSVLPTDPSPPSPPTMEESIKNADAIFRCMYEEGEEFSDCRIDRIYFVNREYDFNYSVGDFFSKATYPKGKKSKYVEGVVVFLSSKHRVQYHATSISNNMLPGFGEVSLSDFQRAVDAHLK